MWHCVEELLAALFLQCPLVRHLPSSNIMIPVSPFPTLPQLSIEVLRASCSIPRRRHSS